MSLLEQARRLRSVLDQHESAWVELRSSRLAVVPPESGRGIELCGDDSDEVLLVILADLGVEVEEA